MSASARVAALLRARQRQTRIEAATAEAVRAQTQLERAIQAKAIAIERHDERIQRAEHHVAGQLAELVRVCGTSSAAAEILGWSVRDLRKRIKIDQTPSRHCAVSGNVESRRPAGAVPKSRSGGSDGSAGHD